MLNDSTELITDLLNLCQKKLILFLVLLFVVATKVVMLEHSGLFCFPLYINVIRDP